MVHYFDTGRFELQAHLGQLQAEQLLSRIDLVNRPAQRMPRRCSFNPGASSLKIIARTSKPKGTLASPCSRIRSCASSRRVMPILSTSSPKAGIGHDVDVAGPDLLRHGARSGSFPRPLEPGAI